MSRPRNKPAEGDVKLQVSAELLGVRADEEAPELVA